MMTVIDEVVGSDEGELEDGEIEEEEGQILTIFEGDFGDHDRLNFIAKPENVKLKEYKQLDLLGIRKAKATADPSDSRPSRIPPNLQSNNLDSRNNCRRNSQSPHRGERERHRDASSSASSSAVASWKLRRANEMIKRARWRESRSPGKRTSKTKNKSRISSKRRSRSPLSHHRGSYWPQSFHPTSKLDEYEYLLREHRCIQSKIKEEQRRLSSAGDVHSNRSHDQEKSHHRSRLKGRGRCKEGPSGYDKKRSSQKDPEPEKPQEEEEDEEMLLLQLRKDALASLAKEEKGQQSKLTSGPGTDDKLCPEVMTHHAGIYHGEEFSFPQEAEGLQCFSLKPPADMSDARPPDAEPETQAQIFEDTNQMDEDVKSKSPSDEDGVALGVESATDAVESEGQFDNYEEVEMEVEDEEDTVPKTLHKAVQSAAKAQEEPSKPESPTMPESPPPQTDQDSEDDEEIALRAQLLKAMLTKRAEKAQVEKVATSNSSTPNKPLSPAPSTPPHLAQPQTSRSSSPVITRYQRPGLSVVGPKPKQVRPPQIPLHQPVVITLDEDSDDSEEEAQPAANPFIGQLDSFLKEVRMSSNKQIESSKHQTDQGVHAHHFPKQRQLPKTPEAMRDAPTPHRQEYDRLREEIARRERSKAETASAKRREQAVIPSDKLEKDHTRAPGIMRTNIQVTLTGGSSKNRTVSKGSMIGCNKPSDKAMYRPVEGAHPLSSGNGLQAGQYNGTDAKAKGHRGTEVRTTESAPGSDAKQKAEMERRKLEEEKRSKQALELEKRRKRYTLLLGKDRGLIMHHEQQITRKRKNLQQVELKLEQLKEQIVTAEKIISVNEAQILKHVKQKSTIEERMSKNLALDDQARAHLAKLLGVPLNQIDHSEYSSFISKSKSSAVVTKRRSESELSSHLNVKKVKTAGETPELKKLREMEQDLAERIRHFRQAEALKAAVGAAAKPVITEQKARLVRRLSASKPSTKIYAKDVIKLSTDTPTNTDSEGEGTKGGSLNSKGMEIKRQSWLDANPSLTPNIKVTVKHSPRPSIAALGSLKAKFKFESQKSGPRLGGQSSKPSETSVASDLLQWLESSEESGGGTCPGHAEGEGIAEDTAAGSGGLDSANSSKVAHIERLQSEVEKRGPDFDSLDHNGVFAAATGSRGGLEVEWCKDTSAVGDGSGGGSESGAQSDSSVLSPSKGLQNYASPLLAFKAFRLSPLFHIKAGLSVQSRSYTNKLDSSRPLCQYELNGTCNDDDCIWQHERDYTMSMRETITDLLSYKVQRREESGTKVINSPVKQRQAASEHDKLLACIENVLGANKEGVVSRLISCPRKWRPRPRPRSQRLSSGEDETMKEVLPLHPPKYPPSSVSMAIKREDILHADEETRYYEGDGDIPLTGHNRTRGFSDPARHGVGDLEAAVLHRPHDIGLWTRLAASLLQDTCCDRALNALSRGLEQNSDSPSLWLLYLNIYEGRGNRAEYLEMCLKATELAPCYNTWWKLLEAEESVPAKLMICDKIMQFLKSTVNEVKTSPSDGKEAASMTAPAERAANEVTVNVAKVECEDSRMPEKGRNDEMIGARIAEENRHSISERRRHNGSPGGRGSATSEDAVTHSHDARAVTAKEISHQCLEVVLFRAQLQLTTGRRSEAIRDLEVLQSPDEQQELHYVHLLTTADLCLAWMSLLHIHANGRLPSSLYDPAAEIPGRIVKKDSFPIIWKSNDSTPSVQNVHRLFETACEACSTHSGLHRSSSAPLGYLPLLLARVDSEEQLGSPADMISVCYASMRYCQKVEDRMILFTECLDGLFRRKVEREDLSKFIADGLGMFPHSCRLHYQQAQLGVHSNEDDFLASLRRCITNFFSITEDEAARQPEEYFLELYRHQLKQPLPVEFKLPPLSPDSPEQISDGNRAYMWLNYIMLTHYTLGERSACEAFEIAIVSVQGNKELELVWLEYLKYVTHQTSSPTRHRLQHLGKLVNRAIVSMAVQQPLPPNRSAECWSDFSFQNRAVDIYLKSVPEAEKAELYEKLLLQMPDNVVLAFRACRYAVGKGFSQLGLQIAYLALHRQPHCSVFWKIIISMALQSQRFKEVHALYENAVLFHPLDAMLWKDYITFEIAHGNDEKKISCLLQRCQRIGLPRPEVLPSSMKR